MWVDSRVAVAHPPPLRAHPCARHQVNTKFVPQLEEHGMLFVGHDISRERMEVLEIKGTAAVPALAGSDG